MLKNLFSSTNRSSTITRQMAEVKARLTVYNGKQLEIIRGRKEQTKAILTQTGNPISEFASSSDITPDIPSENSESSDLGFDDWTS